MDIENLQLLACNMSSPSPSPPASIAPEPSRVRKRRNRQACDQCRLKKAKCDAQLPCTSCITSKLKCSYTSPKKKRGIPTGYLQKLERASDKLTDLLGLVLEMDSTHVVERLLMTAAAKLSDAAETDVGETSNYKEILQRTSLLEILGINDLDLTMIQSSIKKTESKDYRLFANDPSAKASILSSDQQPVEDVDTNQITSLGVSSGFDILFLSSFQRLKLSLSTLNVAEWKKHLLPHSIADTLNIYFTFTHPMFPMLNKHEMYRISASVHEDLEKNSHTTLFWSCVFMSYAQMPVPPPGTKQSVQPYTIRAIHDLVIATLESKHTMQGVQAFLVQALYFWSEGYWSNAWMVVGFAVRMAMDLGLNTCHPDSSVYSLRTWKCCCIIDTILSGRLGRPPQIRIEDYFNFSEPETREEWEVWKPDFLIKSQNPSTQYFPEPLRVLSYFNKFYILNGIGNRLISQINKVTFFSTPRNAQVKLYQDTADALSSWQDSLPSHIDISEVLGSSRSPQILPHRANLYFGFFSIICILRLADPTNELNLDSMFFPLSTMIEMSTNIVTSLLERFPNYCGVTVEYYLNMCLMVTYKDGLAANRFSSFASMLKKDKTGEGLFHLLERLSKTLNGADVTFQYFVKMRDASVNEVEELCPSGNLYSSFLEGLQNFGEGEYWEQGNVIKDMIETLEQ